MTTSRQYRFYVGKKRSWSVLYIQYMCMYCINTSSQEMKSLRIWKDPVKIALPDFLSWVLLLCTLINRVKVTKQRVSYMWEQFGLWIIRSKAPNLPALQSLSGCSVTSRTVPIICFVVLVVNSVKKRISLWNPRSQCNCKLVRSCILSYLVFSLDQWVTISACSHPLRTE